jgi:ribonuclease Y
MVIDFSATPERLLLVVLLSLSTGWALGQYWRAQEVRRNKHRVRREAKIIIYDAQRERTSLLLDAELQNKQRMAEELSRIEEISKQREQALSAREQSLKEEALQTKQLLAKLSEVNTELVQHQREIAHRKHDLAEREQHLVSQLEELSGKSLEQAHLALLEHAKRLGREDVERVFSSEQRTHRGELESRLGQTLAESVERVSRAVTSERSLVFVPVPNDEFKARVVGRDGRNIRAFESLSGVEVLLDEVEGSIALSSFDARRRRIAQIALERLIADGRIQPTRIKEFLSNAANEVAAKMRERLTLAVNSLGIGALHPDVENHLTELGFRARDGQNTLEHLIECAEISKCISAELKLPGETGRLLVRAALLHDIGKALPIDGRSHALQGAELLERCGESDAVTNSVAAHHREVPDSSIICPLVRAVDSMSGGRPGARRDNQAVVVSRAEEMERLAMQHKGVSAAYAFQGGRELQVVVLSEIVAEYELALLAERIFEQTGGRAKVSVVRETISTIAPK